MSEDPKLGTLRTTAARRPQPDALRRFDGVGAHSRRAARHGPPHPGRPAGRGHRRASKPRHRPPAVEPEIPPDGQRHRRSRLGARPRHAFGIRAGLPHVQGVADATHPPDGRGGRRLPTRRLDVSRDPLPSVARGVPPQEPLRLHDHPPRWPRLRRGAPGPGPAAPFPLRPSEGHSRVRLYAPPRHRSNPGSERVGRETDGEVLRATEPQGLLHRRGDQGRARKTGPSPLAQLLVGRQLVQHAEGRERPGQPRAEGLAPSHRSGSGRPCPVPNGWRRLRRPLASAPRSNKRWTSSPTTR